jgi:TonB-dependent SusC/RagA subfamily outer membrane receptor
MMSRSRALAAVAATLAAGACAANAPARPAPVVLASVPPRAVTVSVATPPAPPRSGFICIEECAGEHRATRPYPLYVVDGVVVTGDRFQALRLHPERIREITILTGAEAVARYGAAAANGVVVITLNL